MVDQWSELVGQKGAIVESEFEVSPASIAYYCEMAEHRDPRCHRTDGTVSAPSTMLMTATRPAVWRPGRDEPPPYYLALELPLPTVRAINLGVEFAFGQRLRPGDRVSRQSTITGIIPKSLKIGHGFIVTEEIDYRNQAGEWLGTLTNTLFRYNRSDEANGESS